LNAEAHSIAGRRSHEGEIATHDSETQAQEAAGIAATSAQQKKTNFRWTLAVFAFLATFVAYLDRVNLAVATPSIMQELHFTKVQIGMMQTVFFVCYALFQVPSGTLTEFFGHRKIVPLALGCWSLFTSLTAACRSFGTWIVVRTLFGLGEAPVYPGLSAAYPIWFPKQERGKAISFMLAGSKFGPVVGIPVATLIMIRWGWRSVFVSFGILGIIVAVAYYLLLTNYPHESKFVNRAELEHINEGQFSRDTKKVMPPWKDFFRSGQFWAIGGQFTAAIYINYVFLAWLPVYLLEAHHFSLKQMGFAAAVPELGYALGNIFCGVISDFLIAKRWAGAKSRAWFGGIGLLLCCIGLYLTAISQSKGGTILWLSFALASLGATMNASWTTYADVAGKFAGTVSGWMNFCGNVVGAAAPLITGWVVTRYGWRAAITATASAAIVGAVIWIFVRPDVPLKHRYSGPAREAANV
jgi:ACS family glucarate transporter-like MFS transporter